MTHLYPSINPYNYAENSPLVIIDTDGRGGLFYGVAAAGSGIKDGIEEPNFNSAELIVYQGIDENGDTPTGTATVTIVLDRDSEGTFINADGTPVQNASGQSSGRLIAQGRNFLLLNPESGPIQQSGRTEIGIHGGGTALGANALQVQ